jgi:hypothetical protein
MAYGAITQRQLRDLHPILTVFYVSFISSIVLIPVVYLMGNKFRYIWQFNYEDFIYFMTIVILIGINGYYGAKAFALETASRL